MKYVIFVKGWGHNEDQFYPHRSSNNAEELLVVLDPKYVDDVPVEFYILDTETVTTTHNGTMTNGVYDNEPVFDA